jgi:hypothetical protein
MVKKFILNGGETIKYDNGDVYDGEVKDGKRHGKGKMIYSDNMVYEGEWNDDNRKGRGKLTFPDGSYYDGEFKDNKMEGNGKMKFSNGVIYEGEWKNSQCDGIGKMTYIDGAIYQGNWLDGQKNGKGKMNYFNGNIYLGEWKYNNMNGIGIYLETDGSIYDGHWKDNLREGIGKQVYPNSNIYEGQWKDGLCNGMGKFSYPNGYYNEGLWQNNKKHGKLSRYYMGKNGYIEGECINGLEEGIHTHFSNDGKIIKYYYFNQGKMFTFENRIEKYIISEQIADTSNRYITILMNLHGSDIINSECKLVDNKHVRYISPMKCGDIFINDNKSIIDAFLIAYNISHLQQNYNASTYQKMMKTIEVYNEHNPDFYDLTKGGFRRPIIDHYYSIDDALKCIYIIDTNHSIDIFQDNYDLFSEKNTELKIFEDIEQYNILPKLMPYLNINLQYFLRSNLINVLLDLGYDTINIIDFSCRVFNTDNLTNLYSKQHSKYYVCKYIENPDENSFMGDEIVSRKH